MCRYELLGSGLLYWQRKRPTLEEDPSPVELQPACSTRSFSPSPANRHPSSMPQPRKVWSLMMPFLSCHRPRKHSSPPLPV
ncbi:uncharacterized protein BDW47DRAFT_112493 [Aspergillus candidus]|uniref:Uncharacterized protein n=1 Tax=Aspergillus candidus TaxID=41067 RepID=A0A2I2F0Y8_ASPCN|nr:hypothetical protein BDW47DRAFT_112493 [Aspergillus candidus]PLB34278.1 hypothetical protein BDW47DRAFT_112493 [Aspergillus candidus]